MGSKVRSKAHFQAISASFVLWFLAEDVGKRLDEVLDAILRALVHRTRR